MGLSHVLVFCIVGSFASERQGFPRPKLQIKPAKPVLLLQRSVERAAVATLSSVLSDASANASSAKEVMRLHQQNLEKGSVARRSNCSGFSPCLPYDLTEETPRIGQESSKNVGLAMKSKVSQPAGDPLTGDDLQTSYSDEDARQWSKLLPCELHLAGTTIQTLLDHYADSAADNSGLSLGHSLGSHSISALLLQFRGELSKACKVKESHILMNSVYGRFLRPASSVSSMLKSRNSIETLESTGASLVSSAVPFEERLGEEVVVRFFVVPERDGDDFATVVNSLRDSLANNKSSLLAGKLSDVMRHASLTIGYQDVAGFTSIPIDKLSNLALPFAISAIFTGILIWLAG